MSYQQFKNINDSLKKSKVQMWHIEHIDLQRSVCEIKLGNLMHSVLIRDLVNKVLNKQCCVSNPSALRDYNFNSLLLYHGSHSGVVGDINPLSSRELCDFGRGFYVGDLKEQAETLVSNDDSGTIYTLEVNIDNLKIYNFNDDIKWALYVGVNRGRIEASKYPRLQSLVDNISSNDIVVGLIADDRMMYVYDLFIRGLISDVVLIESLKYVKLGRQFVFKTKKACTHIKILDSRLIEPQRKKLLLHNKSRVIGNIQVVIDDLIKKYRRTGKYIEEILEGYK